MTSVYVLAIIFFLIALVYSSVGFGGGSSYLAIMALPVFELLPAQIRFTALICNIVVVSGSSVIFLLKQKINPKYLLPFLLPSVPMSYLGGIWKLSDQLYYLVLAATLVFAAILLWFGIIWQARQYTGAPLMKVVISASIGLLSGLVGIGGGIFLSPVMHIFRWAPAAEISAITAIFILVNSVSGLAGQLINGLPPLQLELIIPLVLAVFIGGQIGARLGSNYFNPVWIRKITAIIIMLAGLLLFNEHV